MITIEEVEGILTKLKARRFELDKEIEGVDFQMANYIGQRTILVELRNQNLK